MIPLPQKIDPSEIPDLYKDLTIGKEPGVVLRENGIINLIDDISQESCARVINQILEYNLLPPDRGPSAIYLYVNSVGGDVNAAFHLIDIMKQSRIPILTFSMGLVCSAALMIVMAGTKGHRYTTQNTIFMSHQYSSGYYGKEHELFSIVKSYELISIKILEHYRKCTGKSEKFIRKELLPETDIWFSGEDAVRFGIVDEILTTY
jgi:ATP-dependent Clp protease protease subunit